MSRFRALDLVRQFFFRSDSEGIAIPPLDGALTPNDILDHAEPLTEAISFEEPSDLEVTSDGRIFVADGKRIVLLARSDGGFEASLFQELPETAGPLLISHDQRSLFVGVNEVGIVRVDASRGSSTGLEVVAPLKSPSDMTEISPGRLVITEGTERYRADDWVRDLMEKNASGRVLMLDTDGGSLTTLLDGLAFPSGVCADGEGGVLISEAWRHSLTRFEVHGGRLGRAQVVWTNLPGYPGRLSKGRDGFWLSVFALRTHLVEFVLTETEFRREMCRTVDPEHWIRPTLRSLNSGLEPLQGGQLKKLGKMKPWAPARSYGLVLHLRDNGMPVRSLHSRAGSNNHGILSVREDDGRLLLAAAGPRTVLTVSAEEGLT